MACHGMMQCCAQQDYSKFTVEFWWHIVSLWVAAAEHSQLCKLLH
jgi:hypothetical protein